MTITGIKIRLTSLKYTKKKTFKRFLNEKLRIPQRTKHTRLSSGAVTLISTYKNKQIIEVFANIEDRFTKKI